MREKKNSFCTIRKNRFVSREDFRKFEVTLQITNSYRQCGLIIGEKKAILYFFLFIQLKKEEYPAFRYRVLSRNPIFFLQLLLAVALDRRQA
jgi:hypothetical protein